MRREKLTLDIDCISCGFKNIIETHLTHLVGAEPERDRTASDKNFSINDTFTPMPICGSVVLLGTENNRWRVVQIDRSLLRYKIRPEKLCTKHDYSCWDLPNAEPIWE